jgi:lipopolysaccharide transport system permease protein
MQNLPTSTPAAAREVVVYAPDSRRRMGFWRSLAVMTANIIRSRELIRQLFIRDYLAVHKKSFLGFTWIVLAPVVATLSWLFMNAAGVLRPGTTDVPYPVYVLLGTTLWGLFTGFYQSATQTLTTAQTYILQVRYPHEALLVKQALEQVVNFGVALVVNLLAFLWFGVRPSWMIVLLPLTTLPLFFLGAGLGLIIAVLGVVATEFRRLCEVGLGLVLFITPVLYNPAALGPRFQAVLRWNPLTHLIDTARSTMLSGTVPDPAAFTLSALFALGVFLVAWRLFYVSEHRVIEKLF